MWQRIQSVFLGLGILGLLGALFLPIWEGAKDGVVYRLYPIYFMTKETTASGSNITSQYFPFCITSILIVAALTIAVQEFRRFDNRLLQIKLGTLNSLVLVGVMLCIVLFSKQVTQTYQVAWSYDLSLYLTFGAVACNWLAMRFIRRDEKLVKDSDRLR